MRMRFSFKGLLGKQLGTDNENLHSDRETSNEGRRNSVYEVSLMLAKKELIIKEIDDIPDIFYDEVLDFIQFLKMRISKERIELLNLSESALGKDWLRIEEEEAWQDL